MTDRNFIWRMQLFDEAFELTAPTTNDAELLRVEDDGQVDRGYSGFCSSNLALSFLDYSALTLDTSERATLTLMAFTILYLANFSFVVEASIVSRQSTTFSIKFVFVQYQQKRMT